MQVPSVWYWVFSSLQDFAAVAAFFCSCCSFFSAAAAAFFCSCFLQLFSAAAFLQLFSVAFFPQLLQLLFCSCSFFCSLLQLFFMMWFLTKMCYRITEEVCLKWDLYENCSLVLELKGLIEICCKWRGVGGGWGRGCCTKLEWNWNQIG